MERSAAVARPPRDGAHLAGRDGADRVDRGTDVGVRTGTQHLDARRPPVGVAVGEATLHALDGPPEATCQVAGVEEGDADAGSAAASSSISPISFGFRYGLPAASWCR